MSRKFSREFRFYHSDSSDYIRRVYDKFTNATRNMSVNDIYGYPRPILVMQMGRYDELLSLKQANPSVPMYTYVWDCYGWIWKNPRGYDWEAYGKVIQASDHVFVPSDGQRLRLLQHWGIPFNKSSVIPAYAQFFEYNEEQKNEYVCNPLRDIPDRQNGWIERICSELNIPYQHGGRAAGAQAKNWEDYKRMIADAAFIICPWYEASTGGMSLLEGYNINKRVLICDSLYMGAREYFGDRAYYYKPTYNSMKEAVLRLYRMRNRKPHNDVKHMKNFTIDAFVSNIKKQILQVSNGQLHFT